MVDVKENVLKGVPNALFTPLSHLETVMNLFRDTAHSQPDAETRAADTDDLALRLWLRIEACANLVENLLRCRLRTQFGITPPRFDLMAQLAHSPGGLKMGELSKRMMVTGGNVTGITDQLVAEGLVARRDNPQDRRAYIVTLTEEGRRLFQTMADAHEAWVRELFTPLGTTEQKQLYELLASLKTHVAQLPMDCPDTRSPH